MTPCSFVDSDQHLGGTAVWTVVICIRNYAPQKAAIYYSQLSECQVACRISAVLFKYKNTYYLYADHPHAASFCSFSQGQKKSPERLKTYKGHVSLAFLFLRKNYSSRFYNTRRWQDTFLKSPRPKKNLATSFTWAVFFEVLQYQIDTLSTPEISQYNVLQ